MSDKRFFQILVAVLLAGAVSSSLLVAYTVYRHRNASVITYIGNEK